MGISEQAGVIYREKLYPSINTILAILVPIPILWLVTFPFDPVLGLFAASALSFFALLAIWIKAPSIVLTRESLTVGTVALGLGEIGKVSVARGVHAQLERGPLRSADAFVVLRGTAGKLVKIELDSSIDPTPYWLIGSRNPEVLSKKIASAKA